MKKDTPGETAPPLSEKEIAALARSMAEAAEPVVKAVQASFDREDPNREKTGVLVNHKQWTRAQLGALTPPPPALMDGFYRRGEATLLIGASSAGKSTFAMREAYELAQRGFIVATVSAEDDSDNYGRKLKALALLDGDLNTENIHSFESNLPALIVEEGRQWHTNMAAFRLLSDTLGALKPDLVLLETASALGTGDESNGPLAAMAKGLFWLARDLNAAVVMSHHTSKEAAKGGQSDQHAARGGSSFTANTRETLAVVKADPKAAEEVLAQYLLPEAYQNRYELTAQDVALGRVLLVHHAKCANGPEMPPKGYLRVSVSDGLDPVAGALIRLDRVSDAEAGRVLAGAKAEAESEERKKLFAFVQSWVRDQTAKGGPTPKSALRDAPAARRGGYSRSEVEAEVDRQLADGELEIKQVKVPGRQKAGHLYIPFG